ncbi:MAG: BTAD domain-containing putative transcriptional regulator [Actinophytocola sp.]|uniref:AfsR/SARP family transcriptional regulator n=1 Tax=Actinophytocola sp. TaxID=1872138 RepID=UPI003C72ADC1
MRLHAAGHTSTVGEPRQQAVLAVLLLEPGHTVAIDTLVDRVWGEFPPRQARRSLQAHIARIRRVLEDAEPGGARLTRDAGGYRLDIRPDQVDVFRFRSTLHEGADRVALRAGLDLWDGEPLAGLRGDWVERIRRTLRQEHVSAVVAWAAAEIDAGDAAATITRLTDVADEHPLDETVAATLVRALYTVGRGADALACYDRIRRALRDELGADPGPALSSMHEAVLRHDLPSPARPPPPVPAQLPADVTAFTGRAGELDELARVASAAGREPVVVCLTGTAGAGKTATAVHWGHRVRDRFPDGQLYLDLRGYDPEQPVPPEDALAAFLTALLPSGTEIPLGEAERAARFRTEVTGRRMLVVLDNAATVDQVRPLLPGTPTCVVVVTSRDSLGGLVALHGAHRVAVGQLPGADAVALLRRLAGERVDAEPEAAAALADRCVRLPLTLRLAAELAVSRPATPLSRLVDELRADQRTLDLLSGGDDQRAAVRSVFSWSLRQLSADATRAFTALGRHPAPTFDAYVLAALADCPLDRARTVLDSLVRAHLVQPAGSDRYGMHDLLKAYAAESGEAGDAHAALDRVYGYYLATVAAAMDLLYPGEAHRRPRVGTAAGPVPELAGTDDARDWLDAELPTLEVLAAGAAAHGRPEHAVVLSALLFRHLDGIHDTVALAIHGHGRAAARATGDRAAEANALNALGGAHLQAGRSEAAMADMWAAFELFGELGDLLGQARALCNVGMVEERAGRYRVAGRVFARAVARCEEAGDVYVQAHVLTRLGTTEARVGDVDAGREHLRHALDLHRRAGHRFGEAWSMVGLGEIAAEEGRFADAVDLHTEAADLFGVLGHRDSEAWAVDGVGRAETLLGRPADAVRHHQLALDLFHRHGDRDGETWSRNGLGEAHHAAGNAAAARANHAEALTLATRTGALEQEARAHRGLARTGSGDSARHHLDRAVAIYDGLGLPDAGRLRAEPAGPG